MKSRQMQLVFDSGVASLLPAFQTLKCFKVKLRKIERFIMTVQGIASLSSFYQGPRILVTGHTGFKGSWLCFILQRLGAKVTGISLDNLSELNLYTLVQSENLENHFNSIIGDIRSLDKVQEAFNQAQPEVIFHLAAQPIVRLGYQDPVGTYTTNVIGTVHLLDCVRRSNSFKSVINVTTDKVYFNQEWDRGIARMKG